MVPIALYFDFVSPYSWLALELAAGFARRHGVRWELRPVVYAKLLDAAGLVGPAESEVKRQYTFVDLLRCAERLGLSCVGPPAHPFRSIEALRAVCLLRHDPRALEVCVGLAAAAWSHGRDLTRVEVLADVLGAAGVDPSPLVQRLQHPETKQMLFELTDEAIRRGVFGVPTFVLNGELFWGHDRLEHLSARLRGELRTRPDSAAPMLARPRGSERKR